MTYSSNQKYLAELIGTFFLLTAIVGAGIMGNNLSGGNSALTLLAIAIAAGGTLGIMVNMFASISGSHFNPAVSFVMFLKGDIGAKDTIGYIIAQIIGGILGVIATHIMFDLSLIEMSITDRNGTGTWFAELLATFGLVLTIIVTATTRPSSIGFAVGLYITVAHWFTASTSFANPAVSIARSLTNSVTGISPADVPAFVIVQLIGAVIACYLAGWLLKQKA